MKYKLTIQSEDYGFITEAIKLRTLAVLESLEKQVASQVASQITNQEPFGPCSALSEAVVKAEGAPFTFIGEPKKKKTHWTQTAKGKKIMAARKRKGTK